jgi:hypothetical protein
MTYREFVVRGDSRSAHLVQLFDGPESLAAALSPLVREGLDEGGTVLAILVPDHWKLISKLLARGGVMPASAMARGQLIVRNAADLLAAFMRRGSVDEKLFDSTVGALVRKMRKGGAPLRVFGEMVDLLAFEGNFTAALRLEHLCNELAERETFTLFCGYSAAHFGDPRAAEALKRICLAHSHVRSCDGDMLASYLLQSSDTVSGAAI